MVRGEPGWRRAAAVGLVTLAIGGCGPSAPELRPAAEASLVDVDWGAQAWLTRCTGDDPVVPDEDEGLDVPEPAGTGDLTGAGGDEVVFVARCRTDGAEVTELIVWTLDDGGQPTQLPPLLTLDPLTETLVDAEVEGDAVLVTLERRPAADTTADDDTDTDGSRDGGEPARVELRVRWDGTSWDRQDVTPPDAVGPDPVEPPDPDPLPDGEEVVPGIFLTLPDGRSWQTEPPPDWEERDEVIWTVRDHAELATQVFLIAGRGDLDDELALVQADHEEMLGIEPELEPPVVEDVTVAGADRAVDVGDVSISGDVLSMRRIVEVDGATYTLRVSQYIEDAFVDPLDFDAILDSLAVVADRLP